MFYELIHSSSKYLRTHALLYQGPLECVTLIPTISLLWAPAGTIGFFQQLESDLFTVSGGCVNEGLSHGRTEERAGLSFSAAIHIYAAWKQMSNQEHITLSHKARVLILLVWTACRALHSHLYIIKLCQTEECAEKAVKTSYCFPSIVCSKKSMSMCNGRKGARPY